MARHFDVVITGGGPVGLAAVCALEHSGRRTLLIEPPLSAATDPRAIAISYGSRLLLERLGAWSALHSISPITHVHVSQRGGFGRALLSAEENQLPALGYVARYDELHRSLANAASKLTSGWLQREQGWRLTRVESQRDHVSIGGDITAGLLIVADGGATRQRLSGATVDEIDFDQAALVASVRARHLPPGLAFERFAPEGPIALLPFEDRMALVWSTAPSRAQALLALPEPEFLAQLHDHFGDRLGRFTQVRGRAVFPLTRRAVSLQSTRVVLIGNAAQTLHPVAGQGFNLGLRDAWELAQIIARYPVSTGSVAEIIRLFERQRARDRGASVKFTDSLIHLFSNDRDGLRLARGAGLGLLDLLPPLRRAFARRLAFGIRSGQ